MSSNQQQQAQQQPQQQLQQQLQQPLQPQAQSGSGSPSFSDVIQFLNLMILIIGGVAGYFLVERVKAEVEATRVQFEQTKLSMDISKFLNDIRPAVDDSCVAKAVSHTRVDVDCTIKNIGAHRVLLGKPIAKLRIKGNEEFVEEKFYSQKMANTNALPVGTSGASSYSIEVPNPADWSRVEVVTKIAVRTDPLIVEVAKRTLSNNVSSDTIDALSVQPISFRNFVDTSSLSSGGQKTNP